MGRIVCFTRLICLGSAGAKVNANPSAKSFEGQWGSHKGFDFGIHLHQQGNRLTGYHSGATKDGSRTDTAPDGEGAPSITGTIKGNTALAQIHSSYSDAVLAVRMTLQDHGLEWKVTDVKRSGENYVPNKAMLYREHWEPKNGWVRDQP